MQLLKQLYQINSKSGHEDEIKRFVLQYLKGLPLSIYEDNIGNLFITKGIAEYYPCIAAHLDEVHFPQRRILHEINGIVCATDDKRNRIGIGADDKNGIWIALQLLQSEELLKVALFVQEEKDGEIPGCRGSKACDLHFFDNVKFVVQCDRKGNSDIVTFNEKYNVRLCNDDFIPLGLQQKYGYKPVNGGTTDVVALRNRGLAIPCCNISCGYYNAHKPEEYTVYSHLFKSCNFAKDILTYYRLIENEKFI